MNTTKQKIHAALQTIVSNASFHFINKDIQLNRAGTKASMLQGNLYRIFTFLYIIPQQWFAAFGAKIVKAITIQLHKQIALIDESIKEGSCLYPYNFTGSPQSLFLLPTRNHTTKPLTNLKYEKPSIAYKGKQIAV